MVPDNKDNRPVQTGEIDVALEEMWEELFGEVADIHLKKCEKECDNCKHMCTVFSKMRGTSQLRFAICANHNTMKHIAEQMMGEPVEAYEETIECVEEFANIICGRLLGLLYDTTGESIRFQPPGYAEGCYLKEHMHDNMVVHHYRDPKFGTITLLYDKRLDKIIEERAEGTK